MFCYRRKTFQFYIDGRLTPETKRRFESHMAQCQKCQRKFELTKSTNEYVLEQLSLLEPRDIPTPLFLDFMKEEKSMSQKRDIRSNRSLQIPYRYAYALCLIIFVMFAGIVTLFIKNSQLNKINSAYEVYSGISREGVSKKSIPLNLNLENFKPVMNSQAIYLDEDNE